MKRLKSLTGMVAALTLSVSALVTPVAVSQPVAGEQVTEEQVADVVPETAPNSGDLSQKCSLDFNTSTTYDSNGNVSEHHSKVYNPFEPQYIPQSAGFLEAHGWGENRRIITGTVYPVKDAVLSVTFPEGTDMDQLNFSAETNFLWNGRPGYGNFGDVYKNKVTDVSDRTVNETTVTINLGDLAAGTALNLMVQGLVIQGQVDAKLTGTWDPLDVANTPNLGAEYKDIVEKVRPDCFRPKENPADGDRSNVCEVAWDAGVIVDRRYLDWTNNGYTKKIAPNIFAHHVGNMEIQHYIAGPDLYLRIPVVTDADIQNAKLTVELPELDGKTWTFAQYSDRTFGVVNDAEYTNVTPAAPVIEGNTATINVGDFNAGSYFTVLFKTPLTNAELDELTQPGADGSWNSTVQANSTLTGFYPNGAAGTECGYTFGYDDSFTHPGVEVEVNQTGELNPPAGTTYAVNEDTVPAGWIVTIDERTGRLSITPSEDADSSVKVQIGVIATTPDGVTWETTAGVQVADVAEVDTFFINEAGDLIVKLINGLEINLGDVLTPGYDVGPIGGDGKVTIINQTINEAGNTVYEFSDGTILEVKKYCNACEGGAGSSLGGSSAEGSSALLAGSSALLGSSQGSSGDDAGQGGSSDARCVQAAATVGIPLLALLPIGLATQVNIPGLSPLVADAQAQLQSFNTDLQQQSGIHDEQTANFMAQVNAELQKNGGVIGKAVGAAALIAIGGLVGKYLYDSCVPRA